MNTLDHIVVVLEEPQDLVNVAGVARVMKNFGLSRLRLVRPAEFDPRRIEGIAHRTADLIAAASHHEDIDDALCDATYVVGTSARPRTAGRNYGRPRALSTRLAGRPRAETAAVVFGREDRGLSNRSLDRCHDVAIVPTARDHPSLNLAQACLVMAYEIFMAVEGDSGPLPKGRRATRPPTHAELEETYAALEAGLGRIDFFKARKPESVMRTLRRIVAHAEPDHREARLLAAIGYEIGHYLDRVAPRSKVGEEA